MGLLSLGTPLPWEESRKYNEHVQNNGIEQLQNMFRAAYSRENDSYLWGDEVEYTLVHFDSAAREAKLAIEEDTILDDLNESGKFHAQAVKNNVHFHPEYGRFMLEATPQKPYRGDEMDEFFYVETNMNKRREIATKALSAPNIKPVTITSYPLMGVGHFTVPDCIPNGPASTSLFLPDEIINRHARFPTLTANIRKRRGEKVALNIPLYQDKSTPLADDSIPQGRNLFPGDEEPALGAAKAGHIYMDSMGFGMGNSCLQVTVQAPNIHRARYLYDSWVNLAPIMLALTSAAPLFKGFLSNQDVRWNLISGAVDDRTPYERDVQPLRVGREFGGISPERQHQTQRIPKSRYDSIDSYLGDLISNPLMNEEPKYGYFSPVLNDINPPINEKVFKKLIQNPRFDAPLALHFAHLFTRDPLVIYNERIHQNNEFDTDHFENIQSTNWQTLRFKVPSQLSSPDNKARPGWRVEFRPMEIQITDFENAAFSVFIALLGQAILAKDFNFYIPMSKVEANMKTAHSRDAALKKYHFKKDVHSRDFETVELTIDQIVNGCDTFIGLNQMIKSHLNSRFGVTLSRDDRENQRLYYYLELISQRASGSIPTMAAFIRDFVLRHPSYKQDSKISGVMNFDLLTKLYKISMYSEKELIELFGEELGLYLADMQTSGFVNGVH